MERQKKTYTRKCWFSSCRPGIARNQGGNHKALRAQARTVQVDIMCPLCRVRSEVFVTSIIDPPLGRNNASSIE